MGAVNPNAPLSPPAGFSAEGLVGGAGGGGGSTGVIVAGAAGAAAAGVTLAVLAGDDPEGPANPLMASPPTAGTPPDAPPMPGQGRALRACFEMTPASGVVAENGMVRLDASCSTPDNLDYMWDLGDGRMRRGVFIQPTFRNAGSFDVTLTVQSRDDPSQTDGTAKPLEVVIAMADLSVTKEAQISCAIGENVQVTIDVTNNGPDLAKNVFVNDAIPEGYSSTNRPGFCDELGSSINCRLGDMASGESRRIIHFLTHGGFIDVEGLRTSALEPFPGATVSSDTPDPGVANNEFVVDFGLLTCDSEEEEELRAGGVAVELQSTLDAGAGQIRLNEGRSVMVPGGAPMPVRLGGRRGTNQIEARVVGSADRDGTWTFSFSGTRGFTAGSVSVASGDVVGMTSHAVTFRIARGGAAPIRFSFRVDR